MAYDIFISYRRRGGFETAKHLYDLLTKDGYRVSFDIDTLRNGDFDTELLRRIDECRDFILILSEGALDRCVDPSAVASADWVRCELAYALEKNKNIVPIMLAGFTAFPDNLPDDIRKVVRKNGPKYDSYYFDDFYRRLKSDFLETKPEERGDEDAYVTQLLKRDGQVCNDRIPSEILQTVLLYAPVVEAVDMRKQEVRILRDECAVPPNDQFVHILPVELAVAFIAWLVDKGPVRAGNIACPVSTQGLCVVSIGKKPGKASHVSASPLTPRWNECP